jgi:hypothetical protein
MQRAKLLSLTQSASEWASLFKDVAKGVIPDWLCVEEQKSREDLLLEEKNEESAGLLSPIASDTNAA